MTAATLQRLNADLPGRDIASRLQVALDLFGDGLGMTTAFGYSGMILLHHLKELRPGFQVHFIDTRCHFPATMAFAQRIRAEWNLNITFVEPALTEAAIENELGPRAWERDPDACCGLRKVEPLMEILPSKQAWLHALRRDQATTRRNLTFAEQDARGTLKIYPLVDWDRQRCWDYIRQHHILYHPLHDENYPSIGCTHCTASVTNGQPEREGRWVSFPLKLECGLHQHRSHS